MINQQQQREFNDILLEMRARLRRERENTVEALRDDISSPGEGTDLSTHNADQDSEGLMALVGEAKNQEQLLTAVEDALVRIQENKYGQCADCGREIPLERLQALPCAIQCVDCAAQPVAAH